MFDLHEQDVAKTFSCTSISSFMVNLRVSWYVVKYLRATISRAAKGASGLPEARIRGVINYAEATGFPGLMRLYEN